jgi:hypothetical protein
MKNMQLPPPQRQMARPQLQGHGLPTLTGRRMATGSKQLEPPWDPLPSLSREAAPVLWPHKPWFQQLHNMAIETIHYPATHGLFFPGR